MPKTEYQDWLSDVFIITDLNVSKTSKVLKSALKVLTDSFYFQTDFFFQFQEEERFYFERTKKRIFAFNTSINHFDSYEIFFLGF